MDPVENGWENRDMDTPTLVEVWRTGPWLFDGRVADLRDVIEMKAASKDLTDA